MINQYQSTGGHCMACVRCLLILTSGYECASNSCVAQQVLKHDRLNYLVYSSCGVICFCAYDRPKLDLICYLQNVKNVIRNASIIICCTFLAHIIYSYLKMRPRFIHGSLNPLNVGYFM